MIKYYLDQHLFPPLSNGLINIQISYIYLFAPTLKQNKKTEKPLPLPLNDWDISTPQYAFQQL